MSRNISYNYSSKVENNTKRKIASEVISSSMANTPTHQNFSHDYYDPRSTANYAQDIVYNESSDHQNYSLTSGGKYSGTIGASKDDQSYQAPSGENYATDALSFEEGSPFDIQDFLSVLDEEEYHEHDGEVSHSEETVIEGDDAEEVLAEVGRKIPGVEVVVYDEDGKKQKETDWVNDRDPKHFMIYISDQYPSKIPRHDGKSTLGCERAIQFLGKLNKEISEALRLDEEDLLDIPKLEEIRVNLVKDTTMLKNRIKELNRKRSESSTQEQDLVKTASTPNIQLVITPFERAITGIITNAVVSSGKPFEDVYEFLKKKYSLDEREQLSIIQILKDMGHPIFKDRGTVGESGGKKEDTYGVEFIKNYFA